MELGGCRKSAHKAVKELGMKAWRKGLGVRIKKRIGRGSVRNRGKGWGVNCKKGEECGKRV